MSKLEFKSHRKSVYESVSGVGSFTVSIDYTPNFQEVSFKELPKSADSADSLSWDLTATATGYDLVVSYSTSSKRSVKVVLAKLPVNPEQTISF